MRSEAWLFCSTRRTCIVYLLCMLSITISVPNFKCTKINFILQLIIYNLLSMYIWFHPPLPSKNLSHTHHIKNVGVAYRRYEFCLRKLSFWFEHHITMAAMGYKLYVCVIAYLCLHMCVCLHVCVWCVYVWFGIALHFTILFRSLPSYRKL